MKSVTGLRAGVDCGGTWMRLQVQDGAGRLVRQSKAPSVPLQRLPSTLKSHFRRWKIRPDVLTVATRGVWSDREKTRAAQSLKGIAPHVTVMSDVEGAWLSAFGTDVGGTGEGIMVISGTGSIAYGRDRHGHARRAGGFGPLLGDEGSAFWIGKEWLKKITDGHPPQSLLRFVRPPEKAVPRIAALCPSIVRRAQRHHPGAVEVVHEAQQELAELVLRVYRALHWKVTVPISWSGSVLEDEAFRRGFLQVLYQLGRAAKISFRSVAPRTDAVTAAARFTNGNTS